MMKLLKDLNDCMYAMMDEYEITNQSKERALRDIQKKSDEMVFEARKNAEDIYAASIMYTDHALDEIQAIIDKTKEDMIAIQDKMKEQMDERRQVLKDNQIDLKNNLSGLIDRQKYLKLIEAENKRLLREAEKNADKEVWGETTEKIVPEIKINEEYFRAAGIPTGKPDDTNIDTDGSEEVFIDEEELRALDDEYFAWKEEESHSDQDDNTSDEEPKKKGLFGFGRK